MAASVLNYEALITSEHNQRPNYMAMIDATTQGYVDSQNLCATWPDIFDVDKAVGQQLDMIGVWVGASRDLSKPLPPSGITQLPDAAYRVLLQAIIALNHWDGTVPGMYDIWGIVFAGQNFSVLVQDNQDMTMFVVILSSSFSAVVLALLTNGYFDLRPAGVHWLGYYQPPQPNVPVFGLGVENDHIAGLGFGYIVQEIVVA